MLRVDAKIMNIRNETREKELSALIGEWVLVSGPPSVEHDFTFLEDTILITIELGQYRLTPWMFYLASCHEEIKVKAIFF